MGFGAMVAALGGPADAWLGILGEGGDPVGLGGWRDDWVHGGSVGGGSLWPADNLFRFMSVFLVVLRLPVSVCEQLWPDVPGVGGGYWFCDGGLLRLAASLPAGIISNPSPSDRAGVML